MMQYCKKCVTPASRPRITFGEYGICNACQWYIKKQTEINWSAKNEELRWLCDKFRGNGKNFDVIVPCSGGKDGSYVAWRLKHDFGMRPLCITFMPQIQTWIGRENLTNFILSGFDHMMITPDTNVYRNYAKQAFIERGMPKQPFVVGISTAIITLASQLQIPLIMYGEEGEQEYGGASDAQVRMNLNYLKNYYYEGEDPSIWGYWWNLPTQQELNYVFATHWSKFEDWDPEIHARFAKNKCGFQMLVGGSIGTFTNYSQLDDILQDLHTYLMFVKFGFGRCTSDASIEIRRGRMTREQGFRVVKKLDGQFPVEYLPVYLDYFDMNDGEFWDTIDKFANKELLRKSDNIYRPYMLKDELCV